MRRGDVIAIETESLVIDFDLSLFTKVFKLVSCIITDFRNIVSYLASMPSLEPLQNFKTLPIAKVATCHRSMLCESPGFI